MTDTMVLTERDGASVVVFPKNITHIIQNDPENMTAIHFVGGTKVSVKEPPMEILKKITKMR